MTELKRVKELLDYNAETGLFIWKVSTGSVKKGQEAGWVTWNNYRKISVDGLHYAAHRLAWFYTYGEWPEKDLDHIDGNRLNNSLYNLREASRSENLMNRDKMPRNTSGYKGVSLHRETGKWDARITAYGKQYYLGIFPTKIDAYNAYCKKEQELFGAFVRERKENGNT